MEQEDCLPHKHNEYIMAIPDGKIDRCKKQVIKNVHRCMDFN